MKLNRLEAIAICLLASSYLCSAFRGRYSEEDEDEHPKRRPGLLSSMLSHDHPRVISIFSKPANPESPKKVGHDIIGHLGNVLQGGSIGIQVKPLAGVQGIVGHAKKIITGGGRDQVGQPNHDNPEPPKGDHWQERPKGDHWQERPKGDHWQERPKEDHWQERPKEDHWQERPKGDHWQEKPKVEHWQEKPKEDHWQEKPKGDDWQEKPQDDWQEVPKGDHWVDPDEEWDIKEPEKVAPEKDKEGYSWDDIGEDRGGPSTEVPIEDIIMPRRRPKRYVESKIYHVHLMFKSNGKPYKVVERTQNSLDTIEKP